MVGWGLHSHFHVKPNRCVVLCLGWGFDNFNLNSNFMKCLAIIFVLLGDFPNIGAVHPPIEKSGLPCIMKYNEDALNKYFCLLRTSNLL